MITSKQMLLGVALLFMQVYPHPDDLLNALIRDAHARAQYVIDRSEEIPKNDQKGYIACLHHLSDLIERENFKGGADINAAQDALKKAINTLS